MSEAPPISGSAPEPEPPYWCFISYRHADNKQEGRQWATWLHQAIETYEVPADLVGTQNERGETIPERIFPVFRDEEELPADADLASPIYKALDRSKVLVVLCSPRAVGSTYVDNEIRYFKRRGKAERVLAAILEGEPNASWDSGKQSEGFAADSECFPKALQHPVDREGQLILTERAEPIAADFRLPGGAEQGWTTPEAYRRALAAKGGQTPRVRAAGVAEYRRQCEHAKLKIVAGILGLPLGQLTRRDVAYQLDQARRRARALRRWLAAVGVLAVLAIAGGLLAWRMQRRAVASRDAADLARSKAVVAWRAADELISYMQYDLSEMLGKLGQVKMMESINDRIRNYHAAHPAPPSNVSALREKSVALDQRGDVLREEGRSAEALEMYRQSRAIAMRLMQEYPDDPDYQRDAAISYERVGDMQRDGHDLDSALQAYNASLTLRRKLAEREPNNEDTRLSITVSLDRVADVLRQQAKLDEALKYYRESLAAREALLKAKPEEGGRQRTLSVSYNKVGDVLSAMGKSTEALASYRASLDLAQKLVVLDPDNAVWQADLAASYERVARGAQREQLFGEASEAFGHSLEIARRLMNQPDTGVQWVARFAAAAGSRWELVRVAPPFATKLNRETALTDLKTARDAMKQLQQAGRLAPPMDKFLPMIEEQIQAAGN